MKEGETPKKVSLRFQNASSGLTYLLTDVVNPKYEP